MTGGDSLVHRSKRTSGCSSMFIPPRCPKLFSLVLIPGSYCESLSHHSWKLRLHPEISRINMDFSSQYRYLRMWRSSDSKPSLCTLGVHLEMKLKAAGVISARQFSYMWYKMIQNDTTWYKKSPTKTQEFPLPCFTHLTAV